MYQTAEQANDMARAALADASIAERWSTKQRFFLNEVFSRSKALDQARWIRRRTEQLRRGSSSALCQPCSLPAQPLRPPSWHSGHGPGNIVHHSLVEGTKLKRPIKERVYREFKRVWRQATGPSKRSSEQLERRLW